MPELLGINDERWNETKRRADALRPLILDGKMSRASAELAARELGLSVRQIYSLARKYLNSDDNVTALLPAPHSGGGGKSRIHPQLNAIIQEVLDKKLPDKRKFSFESLIREVFIACRRKNIKPPSAATIRRRIKNAPANLFRHRYGKEEQGIPIIGETPTVAYPLAYVQMDHTPVDIVLVDSVERQPIGKPYLTLAIDIYSRCIAGMHIDLDAPSATSVGLCLTHMASDKNAWLSQRGIEEDWPIQGKPLEIGVDNAREFWSKAFQRGCDQHRIKIRYRKKKEDGGVIERVIGTFMRIVHEAPGTTLSNPIERGDYDSEGRACLTLEEFERFLAIAITKYYHYAFHNGLGDVPIKRLEHASSVHSKNSIPNLHTYLIDFLPVLKRVLRRDGFIVDHITYYSTAFHNWLREGKCGKTFTIRRDPRDLSRIYVSIPGGDGYVEAAYRKLAHPIITLFEHRAALRRIRLIPHSEQADAKHRAAIRGGL